MSDMDESGTSKSPSPTPRPKAKAKPKQSTTNTRKIELGSGKNARIAQACDRCRAKKTKCDGKQPQCSNCDAIGIKCIVSDKLSRRAFPKGYTETLEERIRQLEAENNRLSGVIDLRDEQIKGYKDINGETISSKVNAAFDKLATKDDYSDDEEHQNGHSHQHDDGCQCGCHTESVLAHERPVSIMNGVHGPLSITDSLMFTDGDDTNSLLSTDDELISNSLGSILLHRNELFNNGANPAPGAFAAATAIEKMQKDPNSKVLFDKQQMLTALVAASIPRSTEETLFVPTLLASICQTYGYDSKPAVLAANAIGSLKENSNEVNSNRYRNEVSDPNLLTLIMNRRNTVHLDPNEVILFLKHLQLPASKVELDHLTTIYFQEWGSNLPILNKNSFLRSYSTLIDVIDSGRVTSDQFGSSEHEPIEKFGAIIVVILALSFLSNKHGFFNASETSNEVVDKYVRDLKHYDTLIHEFIKPNCLITETCSILSLQILTLSLQYCLAIGDVSTCYVLRGRVITMAQQLRLHRCPAAVLGVSGTRDDMNLRILQQGERRILFWAAYCLDVYCSLNLGVPRLLKDYEIECALPFTGKSEQDDDEEENENILILNNTQLTIVGKVSRYSLSMILYCRVLGSILDGIYSSAQGSSDEAVPLKTERKLECWRRELPEELRFEMGMNGFSLKSDQPITDHLQTCSKQQLCLVFLYFHARILINLPVISKFGNHHDVGLSTKQKLYRGERNKSSIMSSMTMIQQSSLQILEILKVLFNPLSSKLLPLPINLPREHSRLTLLVAKGTLEYIKGGSLYSDSKQLLLDTIPLLIRESKYDVPGGLTKNSAKLIEMAILSILGLPQNKTLMLNKKKLNTIPVTKTAVNRSPSTLQTMTSSSSNENNGFPTGSMDNSLPFLDYTMAELRVDVPETTSTIEEANDANDFEDLFDFDPFKVNLSQNLLINEFAADGSLGLVPFLKDEESSVYDFNRDASALY
ncbi:DNA-binding transcription factor cat8 [Yamadazyma tenuis]|uniref:Zn(2)-C6 fungal-type domain-containing protein n=1 Tax=Candida tenuis (strain ATCC 10573 / BCRC 21748 / CBS 615 / JCM 9827 / NBRC 10315 / NRRL Y-1498 / VKM Y-70) TaxID=590646 RepID=G3AW78_CANTC|nr:uncharacterized protein CANTEDRAFT_117377 [Yamadazyma tenuis ATCC 10573]EGV66474.1 hypothetical protein CANTEDRAFT_117377 [Yamadazyma tenuis ATCC 10573]WEJ95410.1 DNA-binding transcription factor cat8 [Yamadazyma tenuis]